MPSSLESVQKWVQDVERLTRPDQVHWCDGTESERDRLIGRMVEAGALIRLNPVRHPNSYLHRSHPSDVARTEHLTFICSRSRDDAGPTNHWMDPAEARQTVGKLFEGSMNGRTMYVVPYLMGPPGSVFSKVGVEITDSPYVVISMRIMTRMGNLAMESLRRGADYCLGLHSLGDLSPDRRFVLHFPEERLIWSVGSGYGGNALLGKKCFALRIAGCMARDEGWLAEHMLILGLEDPTGQVTYMAAAFPSACGKTNLAMLDSPLAQLGYKVWTVGDDIAWMRVGPDGRLWAVNAESGFFGVAPGTSSKTNPNAIATVQQNSIFTNVALTPDGCPWWDGIDDPMPPGTIDWTGRPCEPSDGKKAAHPNSRYTAPAHQCPSISPHWDDPRGVPISAILFGGRRARLAPLVVQSFNWTHGVFMGATVASETTAAADGKVGVPRRDPMAMLPFCGYHMGDYFAHWLSMGTRIPNPPAIFHVNWFRRAAAGGFLWPGFGENVRVLRWILDRVRGASTAVRQTEIGFVPTASSLDLDGLGLPRETVNALLEVDRADWRQELQDQKQFFERFGPRLPAPIWSEHAELSNRLKQSD